jgi:hypothetical protein
MINAIRPRAGRHPLRSRLVTALTCVAATGIIVTTPHAHAARVAAPVPLGMATTFAALGGAQVANTGASIVTGDVGAVPPTGTTGFPPGIVVGTVHPGDPTAVQARTDLATAYGNAAGQPTDTTIPTQLGGTTRTPGVYDSASDTFRLAGNLTLNAGGDPTAIFIFKTALSDETANSLVTEPGSRVILTGGAQACNVFWQVADSARLGRSSNFAGNILAANAINVDTGATVDGRVHSRDREVNLRAATITRPVCQTLAPGATTVTLTSSCRSAPGGPVTFTTTVRAVNGTTAPTGTIYFRLGRDLLGSAPLVASGPGTARATLINPAIPVGTDRARVTATYPGATGLTPSTSDLLSQEIGEGGRCPERSSSKPVNNTNNNNNA